MPQILEKYILKILISLLAFGLSSCNNPSGIMDKSTETKIQDSSRKHDSIYLLSKSFADGQLALYGIVDTTGEGYLYAKYSINETIISETQTEVKLAEAELKKGIVYHDNLDSMHLDEHCLPFNNLIYFCLRSYIVLNGTDLYSLQLKNGNLKFLKLYGDKLNILTTEGYWVILKNKKYIVKVNPLRGTREKNLTVYELIDEKIILKKEVFENFFVENEFPTNHEIIQKCKQIINQKN